ncbi:MAG TPA: indole-3-glycerol phosphate synthase TrpC [Pyrinomonadaceae bacterium]
MSVLQEIVARKRDRLATAKLSVPPERILEGAYVKRSRATRHRLQEALKPDGVNIIAEFKRKSPSKGVIRAGVDAASLARSYEAGGAVAISVLTEEDYFSGSLEDLEEVKSVVQLPVLRKDFLFEEYQIYESAAAGADAILLIVASLEDTQLWDLRCLAEDELGMDALVEVHDEHEMDRALAIGADLIGVNNRNLHTFEVSLETSLRLAQSVGSHSTLISESGLQQSKDLAMLQAVGYRGFLIGELLMRAEDPEEALRNLTGLCSGGSACL